MKKKLLFVIPGLDAGGAEKSLVNLLNMIDETRFSVDLFLFSHHGLFLPQVPKFVQILPKNAELETFQKPLSPSILQFLKQGKIKKAVQRFRFFLVNKLQKNTAVAEQHSWKFIRDSFQNLETEYDTAIGFLEKSSIYFVVDKVKAKQKIGIIHTVFSKLNADNLFENKYLAQLDFVCLVSYECAIDLENIFPELKSKIKVLPNVVSPTLIEDLANKVQLDLPLNSIVSVGRLEKVKGFDLAIEAAHFLKRQNIDFHWCILGEGSERMHLEKMIIEKSLEKDITLVGLKENPYPYIKQANVIVQPSRYEGKSIVIDEAKILAKPIVLTNFSTAKDQIENGMNGLICEMNPEAIAESILKYFNNKDFTAEIIANLQKLKHNAVSDMETFYKLIDA